ncbi:MAG: hypothetical protein AB8B46_00790 [Candidatus Midichloriaceae bacterium]
MLKRCNKKGTFEHELKQEFNNDQIKESLKTHYSIDSLENNDQIEDNITINLFNSKNNNKEKKQVIPEKESCEDPNKEKNNDKEDDNDDDGNDNDGKRGGSGGNDNKVGEKSLEDESGKYRIDENGDRIDKMEEESTEINSENIEEVQEEVIDVSPEIIKIVIDIEQPVNFLMKNESEEDENGGVFIFIGAEKGTARIAIGGMGSNKELTDDDLINEEVPTIYDSNHYMF